ncbi:ATP-binding protein [Cellulomonas sp. PhB143]|uniref:ATP-binding protein n=1 Tax=Cellulomonas sp. PhB143 TaxID=2485186 RepID=UPI000F9688B9|nr:ATP-binding protein [Cellulomonas sp. PhB143]ROS75463.1 histidine kinase-like protein [Cellulomonas sp. PhB143]
MDTSFTAARAPEGFREVRSWPLFTVDELTALRVELGSTLPGGPRVSIEDVPESVVLVASELATNALSHGRGPATVRLCECDGEILLDVVDRAPDRAPEIASGRPTGQGGFGLRLAARLADEVGWYRTPHAKHVWARFTVRVGARSVSA